MKLSLVERVERDDDIALVLDGHVRQGLNEFLAAVLHLIPFR